MPKIEAMKMANGADVVAMVADNGLSLTCPAQVILRPGSSGQLEMMLLPWFPEQADVKEPVVVKADFIVARWRPNANLEKVWRQHLTAMTATGAGIHMLRPLA